MTDWIENKLRNLSVVQRMSVIVALLLLPMAVMTIVSVVTLNGQEADFRTTVQDSINTLLPLTTLELYLDRALVDDLEAETNTSTSNFAALTQDIDHTFNKIEQYDPGLGSGKRLVKSAEKEWEAARPSVQRLTEHVNPLPGAAGRSAEIRSQKELQEAVHDVELARRHLEAVIKARYAHEIVVRHAQLKWLIVAWATTLSIAAVLIGLFLYTILRPVRALGVAARRLGAGETGVRVPVLGHDELTPVAERFNEMAESWETSRQRLVTEASIDPLTDVLNRRGIMATLDTELAAHERRQRPISVFMVDLDHFKRINDTFGHSAGDQALAGVTHTILGTLREGDHLGRSGGDEFVVILPGADKHQAQAILARVRKAIEAAAARNPSNPTASIGIATAPEDGWDTANLLEKADARLYQAKERRDLSA